MKLLLIVKAVNLRENQTGMYGLMPIKMDLHLIIGCLSLVVPHGNGNPLEDNTIFITSCLANLTLISIMKMFKISY